MPSTTCRWDFSFTASDTALTPTACDRPAYVCFVATRSQRKKLTEQQSTRKPPARRKAARAPEADPGTRNRTRDPRGSAAYEAEGGNPTKPSRKSTRRSSNRSKPDSNLHRRQTRAVRSPKARARKAAARSSKVSARG